MAALSHTNPAMHIKKCSAGPVAGLEGLAVAFIEVAEKIDPTAAEDALNDAGAKFRHLPEGRVILDLKAHAPG